MLKLKLQYFDHDAESRLIWKDPDAGKDWRWEEKGMTEDEMVGWHHQLDEHEFEKAPGVGDGQGGLACCSSWGREESDTTEWLTALNWTNQKNVCELIEPCSLNTVTPHCTLQGSFEGISPLWPSWPVKEVKYFLFHPKLCLWDLPWCWDTEALFGFRVSYQIL